MLTARDLAISHDSVINAVMQTLADADKIPEQTQLGQMNPVFMLPTCKLQRDGN